MSNDFYTLCNILPHNLILEKKSKLIEHKFIRESSLFFVCNKEHAFFTTKQPKGYTLCSCQKVRDAFHYCLDNIFIQCNVRGMIKRFSAPSTLGYQGMKI